MNCLFKAVTDAQTKQKQWDKTLKEMGTSAVLAKWKRTTVSVKQVSLQQRENNVKSM